MTDLEYRLYRVYCSMKQRCNCETAKRYKDYGGRGIKLCDEWENNYKAFKEWALANGYRETAKGSHQCTLDRIDNNKGYSPDNCRFVDNKTQSNNRRSNRVYTFNGESKTIRQWAEYLNVPDYLVRDRLTKLHWSIEDTITTPFRKYKRMGV